MTDALLVDEIEETWLNSFTSYSKDLLKIQTKEGELINFKLNEVQSLLHEIIEDIKAQGRPVRLVILKARREGVSTYVTGRYYWKTSTQHNRYATIVTHEPEATEFLFGMTKRYHTHNEWKPEIRYSNKRILEFNTKDGKGLDSAIRVATAGKEDVGSGQLIHYLHLSEVAKWPKHTTEALLTSIFPCIPNDLESEVIFESTAKGMGGAFHERYISSRYQYEVYLKDGKPAWKVKINEKADEDNMFASIFFPWFIFSEYQMEPTEDFKRTADEEELVKLYGLTDKHLQWRRWAIPNICGGSLLSFMQEYPSNAIEAFVSSGNNIFDQLECMKYKKMVPPPKVRYTVQISTGNFLKKDTGELRVYSEPVEGSYYVIGADVAEGLKTGDFSCADVVDQLTGEHMAQWHGKIPPLQFALVLMWLGRRYNVAWLCPEKNMHSSVIERLLELRYPKLWVEKAVDQDGRSKKKYGWTTSRVSKPLIIDNLVDIMTEDVGVQIKSAETFDEMLTYKEEDGKMEAEEGYFDDRVVSMAIAQYCRARLRLPSGYKPANPHRFEPNIQEKIVEPSSLGWT